MMPEPPTTHLDYAEEAEAAQRAEAWPQAAALWRRARDVVRATGGLSHLHTRNLRRKYEAAADQCDAQNRIDQLLEHIAQTTLRIPTLRQRDSNGLDFHEVSVWGLKRALLAAYEASRDEVT